MTIQFSSLACQLGLGKFSNPREPMLGPASRIGDRNYSIDEASRPRLVQLARASYGPMLTFEADTVIGHSLRTTGTFQEAKIQEVSQFLVRKYAFQPETFVDIGANIGTHLVFALKEAGYQEGFGIEPDVNNFRLLLCNVLLNGLEGRTSLFNLALSDDIGWAELELSTENFGDHRIRKHWWRACGLIWGRRAKVIPRAQDTRRALDYECHAEPAFNARLD